jgi:serine/threonine protein kinase
VRRAQQHLTNSHASASLFSRSADLGIDTETGQEVAWNVIRLAGLPATEIERVLSETDLLKVMKHDHIIEFYDIWKNVGSARKRTRVFMLVSPSTVVSPSDSSLSLAHLTSLPSSILFSQLTNHHDAAFNARLIRLVRWRAHTYHFLSIFHSRPNIHLTTYLPNILPSTTMPPLTQQEDEKSFCFITLKASATLKEYIERMHPVRPRLIRKWCRQILSALNYLHSMDPAVIHRDLKCDNIFIDGATGNIKLGDFGLSANKKEAQTMLGTPGRFNHSRILTLYSFLRSFVPSFLCSLSYRVDSITHVYSLFILSFVPLFLPSFVPYHTG